MRDGEEERVGNSARRESERGRKKDEDRVGENLANG